MPLDYRFQHQPSGRSDGGRRAAWIVYVLLGVALIAFAWWLRAIMLPFILGLLVAYILAPLVGWLQNKGVPRWVGVLLCYFVIFGALVGGSAYLAPKLKTESVKVLQTFRDLLAGVPETVDRVGEDLALFMEKLEGASADTQNEGLGEETSQAAAWGYGPTPTPITVFDVGLVPALSRLEMGATDRELSDLVATPENWVSKRSTEELEAQQSGSHIVLRRLDEGTYGLTLNESTIQVTEAVDGSVTISPRAAGDIGNQAQNFRNRIVKGLRSSLERFAGRIVREVVGFVGDAVGIFFHSIIMLTVLLMVAGFVLVDIDRCVTWHRSRVPVRYRDHFDEVLRRLDVGLGGVVRGQLLVCLFNGILSGIGFWIFIPEYALVLAVFAGVMSLIPIFGTIISTLPAALVGLSISWGTTVGVVLWVVGVHALEANFLSPKILSKHAKVHPVLVVLALVAGEAAFGIVGALLAVPALSLVQTVMGFFFDRIRPNVIES